MFVRHQKATAHWLSSIWPNMEGKNAAFSRNQNGKKKKKGGRFSCMLCAQRDRALTLTTQWPQSWLALQTAWLMVMSDLPWHPSRVRAQTRTPARLWSQREARGSFHCPDISFLNTHKSFLHFHIWAPCSGLSCTRGNVAPWKGTFLSVKKQPSKRHSPQLKLETVCLSGPPSMYKVALTFPLHRCRVAERSMRGCHYTRNLKNYGWHCWS